MRFRDDSQDEYFGTTETGRLQLNAYLCPLDPLVLFRCHPSLSMNIFFFLRLPQ